MRRLVRRLAALASLLTVIGVTLLALAAPAAAHASLQQSTPLPGSQVAQAPTRVTLAFSEAVGFNARSITVTDGAGRRVDRGAPHTIDGSAATVGIDLAAGLTRGSYTVVWRVVSAYSHPVAGTFSFGVGMPAGSVGAAAESDSLALWLHGLGR